MKILESLAFLTTPKVRSRLLGAAIAALFSLPAASGCSTAVEPSEEAATCPTGQTACNGWCVDLNNNATSCGACGNLCQPGSGCAGGVCQCQAGLTACTNGCSNIQGDGNNCGGCDIVCQGAQVCSLGACSDSCAVGTACGNSCVDQMSDTFNCGACGNVCNNGMQCVAGACQCPAGAQCDMGVQIGTGGNGGGTGGVGNTGGGTGDTGGTGGGEITDPAENGGYISSVNWFGYAFTSTWGTATISPDDFGDYNEFGADFCATGNVPATMTGEHGAMIGWSINQAPEDGAPAMAITPTLEGISYNITNTEDSQLRLQIQGVDGADDPEDRWCINIGTGGEGYVAFKDFVHECWGGAMNVDPWNGEPISQVLVVVPASATAAVDFGFCVNELYESTSDGTSAGEGCDLGSGISGPTSGTMNISGGNIQRHFANNGNPRYAVQNNIFNPQSGANIVNWDGNRMWVSSQAQSSGNETPIGYPSLFIGSKGGDGWETTGSNLPVNVGSINTIPTAWRWKAPASGKYNVAYDVWFSPSGPDSGPGNRTFLMVWFHATNGANAEGQGEGHVAGSPFQVDGKSFNVYLSDQFEGRPVISYVATSMITEWSFDLNTFIEDAKGRTNNIYGSPIINDSMSLTNIFAGFEIWNGSQGIETEAFCAEVNP